MAGYLWICLCLCSVASMVKAKCVRTKFPSFVHVDGQDFFCDQRENRFLLRHWKDRNNGIACNHDGTVLGCYYPSIQGKRIDRERTDFNQLCGSLLNSVGRAYANKSYSYPYVQTAKEVVIYTPQRQWKMVKTTETLHFDCAYTAISTESRKLDIYTCP